MDLRQTTKYRLGANWEWIVAVETIFDFAGDTPCAHMVTFGPS